MIRKLNFGDRDTITIKNENISGIGLRFIMTSTTVNTDPTIANLDLSYLNIEGTLTQGGKSVKCLPANIEPVLVVGGYKSSLYKKVWHGTREAEELVAKGAAVKGCLMLSAVIPFGGPINLDGKDELVLNVNIQSSTKPSDAEAASSYVEIETIETIGKQLYMPIWEVYPVRASESGFKESLGDNVTGIYFVNKDKTAIAASSKVIISAALRSDRKVIADTYESLLSKRSEMFLTKTEADYRYQSFVIHEGGEVDAANLDLSLTSSNVNASKNFVVVSRFETSAYVSSKYEALRRKHQRYNASKLN